VSVGAVGRPRAWIRAGVAAVAAAGVGVIPHQSKRAGGSCDAHP